MVIDELVLQKPVLPVNLYSKESVLALELKFGKSMYIFMFGIKIN